MKNRQPQPSILLLPAARLKLAAVAHKGKKFCNPVHRAREAKAGPGPDQDISMKRRNFIRLFGGSVILAASGWGVSRELAQTPASAVAAWHSLDQYRANPRHWVLAHALLAPNPHNLQPWLADLSRPQEILLSLDPGRHLPATDPFGRQIMMGAGAFLEMLALAAEQIQHHAEITLFPQGEPGLIAHDKPFAHVRLIPGAKRSGERLFGAIYSRRTERGLYDDQRPLLNDEYLTLQAHMAGLGVDFGVAGLADGDTANKALLEQIRLIVRHAWKIELETEATFMESMRLMRIGRSEIDVHRDGITIADPMLVTAVKLGLFARDEYPGRDSMAIRSQIERFDALTASTPSYFWLATRDNTRRAQIAAGRTYARLNLAATTLDLVMHPNEQALQEYPEMRNIHGDIHETLPTKPSGSTIQMLARLGHLPPGVAPATPAPRRELESLFQKKQFYST